MSRLLLLSMGLWACGSAALGQTDPCTLLPDPGPCEAAIPAWYFDQDFQTCTQFVWGGCGGTVPFETLEECEAAACGDGSWGLSGLCDSIAVTSISLGDAAVGHLEVLVEADYATNYWFGYAGFALFDASGGLVAAEDVATAPNAYGFDGLLGPHTRYLEYASGVDLSTWGPDVDLELRLYEGWMAGPPTQRCAWTWTSLDVTLSSGPALEQDPTRTPPEMWFDLLGRPAAPEPGRMLLRRCGQRTEIRVISE